MKTFRIFGFLFSILLGSSMYAQTGVAIPTTATDPTAELNIVSTTKGVLIPSLTYLQMYSIASPATGLLVFNSNNNSFEFYNGSSWEIIGTIKQYPTASLPAAAPQRETGLLIYNTTNYFLDFWNGANWMRLGTGGAGSPITP